jgi:HSP20 family protein
MQDLHRIVMSSEVREFADEVGRLLEEVERAADRRPSAGHCTPALDVLETETAVELVIDLPGTSAEHVRVMLKGDVVIVAGEKASPYAGERGDTTFHVVERGYGRFARAVRVDAAVDGAAARATLRGGELRVVLPKIVDRRGKEILVPVVTA